MASDVLSDIAVPLHPAISANTPTGHLRTPIETSRDKPRHLLHTPAAFTQRPLDDDGLCHLLLARPQPPRLICGFCPSGHGFVLRLPSHPASRRRSCLRLVVKRHLRHRGLAPPSDVACPAYKAKGPLSRAPRQHYRPFGRGDCHSPRRLAVSTFAFNIWLRRPDSNRHLASDSRACCPYTTPESHR